MIKGIDIKKEIDANNAEIEKNLVTHQFVLNKKIEELLIKNENLQKVCPHEYGNNNLCIYCYKMKED